jgi:mannose-1-phosphate guanylyltransferase / mannose-6-phosphate isomerase
VHILILSGGGGTRLWPLSRHDLPKQFHALRPSELAEPASSLLLDTLQRLKETESDTLEKVYLVTGADLVPPLSQGLEHAGFSHLTNNIIVEPVRRNTAPAIALAAALVTERDALTPASQRVLCILPADHAIEDAFDFRAQLKKAKKLAEQGYIVTLGVKPDRPETGYGYIEVESGHSPDDGWMPVKRFVEKPDVITAEQYVASGQFFWNAGIFVLSVETLQTALAQHAPAVNAIVRQGYQLALAQFADMPNISFDYAVMEKAEKVAVIPLTSGWSDIGSWDSAFAQHATPDDNHNAIATLKLPYLWQSLNNQVWSNTHRTLALVGVSQIAIIDTPDATLIYQKGQAQAVRHLVEQLTAANDRALNVSPIHRFPWGQLEVLVPHQEQQLATYLITLKCHQTVDINRAQGTVSLTIIAGQLHTLGNVVLSSGSVMQSPSNQPSHKTTVTVSQDMACKLIGVGEPPEIVCK